RIGRELRGELRVGQRRAPGGEGGLQSTLGLVDLRSRSRAFGRPELAEPFQEIGEGAGLAKVTCLAVFQRRRIGTCGEIGERRGDDAIQLFHRNSPLSLRGVTVRKKKGRRFASLFLARFAQAREALACSAIFAKATLSCTARSASTFRSMSIDALLRPFMNTL